MISKKDLICIGSSFKTHGFKGEITMSFDYDYDAFISKELAVFVEIEGTYIPYFIEHIRTKGNGDCFVKFEDVYSDEMASELIKKPLFALKDALANALEISVDELEEIDQDIIGYKVYNKDLKHLIGVVENIEEGIEYPYLVVRNIDTGSTVSIPFVEDFIISISEEDGSGEGDMILNLPEGLIDL